MMIGGRTVIASEQRLMAKQHWFGAGKKKGDVDGQVHDSKQKTKTTRTRTAERVRRSLPSMIRPLHYLSLANISLT